MAIGVLVFWEVGNDGDLGGMREWLKEYFSGSFG